MTLKEAERQLNYQIGKLPPNGYEGIRNALLIAKDAVEMRIPKPPLNKVISSIPSSTDIPIYKGFCPHCKKENYVYSFHPYCDMCGQAIDWSEHHAEG